MRRSLFSIFADPPSEFRGAPFWAWNSKLDPEELRRQIRVMKRMGMGGFFMHARVGLDTAYLSKDWFACVRACVDEAKKLGMRAWLYDEDRWPSGAAGGLVTRNPRFRMRRLKLTQISDPSDLVWTRATLGAFIARIKGFNAFDVRQLSWGYRPLKLRAGEEILVFTEEIDPMSSWYNGFAYLDTMNPVAVREFIRVTHEAYLRHEGSEFGATIPGIFTDEPNHGGKLRRWDGNQLPWTPGLLRVFKQRYGYDLLPHLPRLFFDVGGEKVSQARYHYHDCTTHLFVDAFARQIGEWCGKHGLDFTGHVLSEESLSGQSSVVGDCMRFYEYMQAPGMDLLMETNREFDTAKQVSSVARQFGRQWRVTETYGCTGWAFSFRDQKALSDWQAALGINLRCQHLSWYSMLGEAKRDYPASIFFQSPWWESYAKVEDYYARIHAVMTRGSEVRDLLVIHPVESMWLLLKKGWQDDLALNPKEYAHVAVRDTLLAANIDFDYGSEEILARHARVTMRDGRPVLSVGKADYTAVVVPPMVTMRGSTLRVLERFRDAGGLVVFAGDPPTHVEALPSNAPAVLAGRCVRTAAKGPSLVKSVNRACRRVSIVDAQGKEIEPALYLLREDRENYYLFVCNTSQPFRPYGPNQITQKWVDERTLAFPRVTIRGFANCKGDPLELDPDTGGIYTADFSLDKDGVTIRTSLPRLGSRLFVVPKSARRSEFPRRVVLKTIRAEALTGAWAIHPTELNPLVLDRPSFRIGGGHWQAPREILAIDRRVRQSLGVEPRGGEMVQPWARKKISQPKRTVVDLKYFFDVKEIPGGDVFLAVERPETFRVAVNGRSVDSRRIDGWWVDPSLQRIALPPGILRKGRNEILMSCDYREDHSGLEIAYLLGDFGTEVHGANVAVIALPTRLRLGDWTTQGFAFYSGALDYVRTIRPRLGKGQRIFVEVPKFRGSAVRVLVNGTSAGVIAWDPQEVDVTDLLVDGDNELRLQVISHRRNSHGPLHLRDPHPAWTGSAQFDVERTESMDGYHLVACGLMQAPRLAWRQ